MDPSENPRKEKRGKMPPQAASAFPPLPSTPDHEPLLAPNSVEDARREKIEKLKRSIADGTYRISNEEVARKLIDHMLEPKD
jgi:anti-sigma28 factor (negative regulator of flagellin synthesis)